MNGSSTTSPANVNRCRQRSTRATGNGAGWPTRVALSAGISHTSSVASMNSSPGTVARPRGRSGDPADAVEATLAGDDHPLGRVAQHRVGRGAERTPGARPAGAALLLPHHLAAQQQPEVVLQDRRDVGGEIAIRAAAEVGDVDRDPAAGFERARRLGEHVAQHREVLDVVGGHVALAERRLVLLAGEVRRRRDHEGHRRVGHLAHVAGIADVDHIESRPVCRACRRR